MLITPQMQSEDYQATLNAFADGSISSKTPMQLQASLLAIAMNSTGDDGVQARDIIQALTINHILLQQHIDALERRSAKMQRWVIALAVAAIISPAAQYVWPLPTNSPLPPAPTSKPTISNPSQGQLPSKTSSPK